MSTDLLPESVNLFLDDFETSLCLPILVVMVLCTAQFVFNHAFGIGYTIYQSVKNPATEDEKRTNVMSKLKEILAYLGIGKPGTTTTTPTETPLSREEEWDYCEEYVK